MKFENLEIKDYDRVSEYILCNNYSNIFLFYGEMGSGKTTLIQSLCRNIGVFDKVLSPTFSIINEYQIKNKSLLYHFDFYRIKTIDEWSLNELNEIMNINVWSNKLLLDWLLSNKKVSQVIAISSGASIHTYKGWSGYSLSKTALKMLMDVYSKDTEGVQFISVAPGLVSTSMQDYLCNEVDENKFPVTKKFIAAKKDGSMKTPDQIAEKFVEMIPQFQTLENGTFIDLRDIN